MRRYCIGGKNSGARAQAGKTERLTVAKPAKLRLGEILLNQHVLTPEALQAALDEQKHNPRKLGRSRRLGRVLIDKGYAPEEKVAEALALQLGLPYVDLKHYNIRPEVTQKLPEAQARRHR